MTAEDPLSSTIGRRLREVRLSRGRSLASVAAEMGISSSALSQIETGVMRPSVNRLVELVRALQVPISLIFEEEADHGSAVGGGQDTTEIYPGVVVGPPSEVALAHLGQGVTYRRLTPFAVPGIDLFESTYPAGTSSSIDGAMLVHEGWESGFVTQGELVFEFTEGEVLIGVGGSLAFEALRPHRVVNRTDNVGIAIWMTLPRGLPTSHP